MAPNEPASWDGNPCEAPSHVSSTFGCVTSLDQWDISKLSDTSRGLISPYTLELVVLAPWKDAKVSRRETGPKERPCEMRHVDRDATWRKTEMPPGKPPAECCHMDDPSQQKKRAEEPRGWPIESWAIIRCCFKALTFGTACYTATDETDVM